MTDTKPPAAALPMTVRALIGVSWVLGWLLLVDGLYQRATAAHLPGGGAVWPWVGLAASLGLGPLDTGWPWLIVGSAVLGASFGVYSGRRWGFALAVVASVVALAYALPGTLLAAACLLLLALPATRRHIQPA